jgi:predicted alpha/beta superfamily hydrolase
MYAQRVDSLHIYSKELGKERKVRIYTPWEYDHKPNSKFEVIYVFDAQAKHFFDIVHATLPFLNKSQFPMIVVGVVSENRNVDFLPKSIHPETFKRYNGNIGKADQFINFLGKELIPYMDENYRTLPKRIAIGHSNGGTFITYSLLKNPELFDAYIAISPNYPYDKEQIYNMMKEFDSNKFKSAKFIYMCNANEGDVWTAVNKKVISSLKSKSFKDKIVLVNQDFSKTTNHVSVFPVGVLNGLQNYLEYQFFNVENLIAYYNELNTKKQFILTPEILLDLSASFLRNRKIDDAISILLWAVQLFPDELNLYNNIGEMYQKQQNNSKAIKYYNLYLKKLDLHKEKFSNETLENLKNMINTRIKSLEY